MVKFVSQFVFLITNVFARVFPVEIFFKWRGFEETWEPAVELYKDVPDKVMKFLREHSASNPLLQKLKQQLQQDAKTPQIPKVQGRSRGRGRFRGRGRGRRGRRGRGNTQRGRARGRGQNV